jgi:hypothetical protein
VVVSELELYVITVDGAAGAGVVPPAVVAATEELPEDAYAGTVAPPVIEALALYVMVDL